jgi:hypothetical protein
VQVRGEGEWSQCVRRMAQAAALLLKPVLLLALEAELAAIRSSM